MTAALRSIYKSRHCDNAVDRREAHCQRFKAGSGVPIIILSVCLEDHHRDTAYPGIQYTHMQDALDYPHPYRILYSTLTVSSMLASTRHHPALMRDGCLVLKADAKEGDGDDEL